MIIEKEYTVLGRLAWDLSNIFGQKSEPWWTKLVTLVRRQLKCSKILIMIEPKFKYIYQEISSVT